MPKRLSTAVIAAAALAIASSALAQDNTILTAALIDSAGVSLGTVEITVTPHGVLVHAEVTGVEPGVHAFNIHEKGECNTTPPARPEDPAIFAAAGGHLDAGDHTHGFLRDTGPHTGDMPNLFVPESGMVTVELYLPGVTQDMLMDDDGSSIVIRENRDDYLSGSAGDRIGCGVIELAM